MTKSPLTKFEILQEEISKMIEKTTNSSIQNKKKSFRIYIGISISSALVTFLVAIGGDIPKEWSSTLKVVTLFFSALSTVLAAWDGFYNHKQLWVYYGDSKNNLKALLLKLRLLSDDDKNNQNMINEIHKEYQAIMNKGNYKWKELRLEDNAD
ncbi:SLATT domain-containing protein [uncultured Tenacibaculum sp.]|uniref:SLATT domain-containing protein n=1 Tax=uncultured Tenacibaculum sp. TaxID=174713 RepID=UPI00262D0EEF|nr:SLATT domain-containing protein [uncultured Tenacibaculum sp.]